MTGVVLCATLLRFAYPFWAHPLDYLFSDPLRHWQNGGRFFTPELLSAMDPTVYQLWLHGLFALGGPDNRWAIAAAQGVLCALTPWVYAAALQEAGTPRRWCLVALVVLALHPSLWAIFRFFMIETLLLPLTGAALWATMAAWRRSHVRLFLLAVLLWTLAVLTKSVVVPAALVSLAFAWWRLSARVPAAILAAVLAAVLVVPAGLRTQATLGNFEPTGSPWISRLYHVSDTRSIRFFWGNRAHYEFTSPAMFDPVFAPLSAWTPADSRQNFSVAFRFDPGMRLLDVEEAIARDTRTPERKAMQALENAAVLLFGRSWPDDSPVHLGDRLAVLLRWLWGPAILTLLIGTVVTWRRTRADPIVLAGAALSLALLLQPVFTVEGRYRKPLEPLVILSLARLAARRGVPYDLQEHDARSVSGASAEGPAVGVT